MNADRETNGIIGVLYTLFIFKECMMRKNYEHNFYKDRHIKTVYAARTILTIVLDALPPVNSAIDFGCGVGTWLFVLKEKGVSEIAGLDGPWVDQNLLVIPKEDFHKVNFEKTISIGKKYDLALTLEVAEHIPEKSADGFIDSLVSASDFVLFSAAIPFQGGTGHVNEQWPDYWAEMFAKRGYVVMDFIRRMIWNDSNIPTWYRQNILLFVKKEQMHMVKEVVISNEDNNKLQLSLVHPEVYLSKVNQIQSRSIKGVWKSFGRLLKKSK